VGRPSASGVGSIASAASLPERAFDRSGPAAHPPGSTVTPSQPAGPDVGPCAHPGDAPGEMMTAVTRLRTDLRSHRTVDERESFSMAIMLAELDRLPRPFDEGADLTHVTASAIVVGTRGVVLHQHRRLNRWLQPGGHLEPGETPEEAVIRECVEETGLAVRHPTGGAVRIHVDVHEAAERHVHLDLRYLVSAPDADPSPAPGESQDVAWFTWEDAVDLADEALVGALVATRSLIEASRTAPSAESERSGRWPSRSTP
jgi:8-oxo-dGTP pyrophosphatase MutT (NUDIX family)